MTLKKYMLVALGLGLATNAMAGIKEVYQCNGVKIIRIKHVGILTPGSVSYAYYATNQPGTLNPLAHSSGPGVLQQVAQPAAIAGGLAAHRPSTTKVSQNAGNNSNENWTQGGEAIVNNAPGNGNNGNGGNPHFLP